MNFRGKNFCISGFDSTNEDDVRRIIEHVGGVLRSSVVKDLGLPYLSSSIWYRDHEVSKGKGIEIKRKKC